jgi:ABC-2 type transport system ATP-binding protein
MILRRGRIVAMGSMPELRKQFGSVSFNIFFSSENPGSIRDIPAFTPDGGQYLVKAGSIGEMNTISGRISEGGGIIERIESHFPSLEEMLVKIGQ